MWTTKLNRSKSQTSTTGTTTRTWKLLCELANCLREQGLECPALVADRTQGLAFPACHCWRCQGRAGKVSISDQGRRTHSCHQRAACLFVCSRNAVNGPATLATFVAVTGLVVRRASPRSRGEWQGCVEVDVSMDAAVARGHRRRIFADGDHGDHNYP